MSDKDKTVAQLVGQFQANLERKGNSPERRMRPAVAQSAPPALSRDNCPVCDGRGWYTEDLPVGHKNFGKSVICECSRIPLLFKTSGLTKEEQAYSFEFTRKLPGRSSALAMVEGLFGEGAPAGFVGLFGPYGTGKSGVAKAAVAKACQSGVKGVYAMAQNIIEDSYSSFQEDNAQSTNQVRDKWAGYPLLVIDEFDAMSGREWSINFMRSVLDARYRYREERATIIISNSYPLTRMKQWDAQKQRDVCALLGVKALAELPALPSHLGWLESRLDGGNFAFMVGHDLRAKAK